MVTRQRTAGMLRYQSKTSWHTCNKWKSAPWKGAGRAWRCSRRSAGWTPTSARRRPTSSLWAAESSGGRIYVPGVQMKDRGVDTFVDTIVRLRCAAKDQKRLPTVHSLLVLPWWRGWQWWRWDNSPGRLRATGPTGRRWAPACAWGLGRSTPWDQESDTVRSRKLLWLEEGRFTDALSQTTVWMFQLSINVLKLVAVCKNEQLSHYPLSASPSARGGQLVSPKGHIWLEILTNGATRRCGKLNRQMRIGGWLKTTDRENI